MNNRLVGFSNFLSSELTFSFWPIAFVTLGMAVGPYLGIVESFQQNYSLLGLSVSEPLLRSYSVYVAAVFLFILLVPKEISFTLPDISSKKSRFYLKRIRNVILLCFLLNFYISGQYILSGQMDRGSVRISLGLLGPINTWIIQYVLPSLSLLNLIFLKKSAKKRATTFLVIQNFLLVALIGFMTGYKFTTIMIFLPTISLLWSAISASQKIIIIASSSLLTVLSQFIFSMRDGNSFADSTMYVQARTTIVAAYGVIASWEYSQSHDIPLLQQIIFAIFGGQLSEFILGTSDFAGSVGKLVTVAYYPDTARALAGSVNLTLTLFGESVALFHEFWIFAVVSILSFAYYLYGLAAKKFRNGNLPMAITLVSLMVMGFMPVINSGGVFALCSLPIVGYVVASYFLLSKLLPKAWKSRCQS
jgi:hypothetical protein